jgi:hypothetical protein
LKWLKNINESMLDGKSIGALPTVGGCNEHKPELHTAFRGHPELGGVGSTERSPWRQLVAGLYELGVWPPHR